MKCLVVAMSAPREHEPNIQLARELGQRGVAPCFLTHLQRTADQLRQAGLTAWSIGEITQASDGSGVSDQELESRFGLISLRDLCFPEHHLTGLPERLLIGRARRYLTAVSRLLDDVRPLVVLQNSGGELLRRVVMYASKSAGIPHLFIRPTPFKGRSTWSIDSERGDWTILDAQGASSSTAGDDLVAAFRRQKTRIARLNIPLPQSSQARTLVQLALQRRSESEPMGVWDPGLRFRRFAAATVRAALQPALYSKVVENEPFVFYPLHVWHDSAITVRAPQFIRQQHLIHTIADALPQGWKLYVKEHPVSVGRNSLGAMIGLARRDNIRIIAPAVASHYLVERAKAIVVINSTAGFEALAYYKPVIVLGHPFYSGRGLTIDVEDLLDLRAAFKLASSFRPDPIQVDDFFARAHACTFPGTQITPDGDVAGIAAAVQEFMTGLTDSPPAQVLAR